MGSQGKRATKYSICMEIQCQISSVQFKDFTHGRSSAKEACNNFFFWFSIHLSVMFSVDFDCVLSGQMYGKIKKNSCTLSNTATFLKFVE